MNLIIKGMKLPQSCSTCRFSYFTVGIRKRCEISGDEVNPLMDCRETNCPLVEIPTPHGDLVDRDDLIDEINRVTFAERYDYNVAYNIVTDAETIIEAEVSE